MKNVKSFEGFLNEGFNMNKAQRELVRIFKNQEIEMYKDGGTIEVITPEDVFLDFESLKQLNMLGLCYETEQINIDYEHDGPEDVRYMNIYYFKPLR